MHKKRNNAHKNFLEFSNGMKEVSKYNRLISHSKKSTSEELENKLTN